MNKNEPPNRTAARDQRIAAIRYELSPTLAAAGKGLRENGIPWSAVGVVLGVALIRTLTGVDRAPDA